MASLQASQGQPLKAAETLLRLLLSTSPLLRLVFRRIHNALRSSLDVIRLARCITLVGRRAGTGGCRWTRLPAAQLNPC